MNEPTSSEQAEVSVEIVDDGPCQKRLKAEVPAEAVTKEVDSNYKQLMDTVQLPGFRKGRVPRSVLERRYAEKIEEEVREELIHSTFAEEVEKRELRVVGDPSFDNVEFQVGEPLRYEAVFETAPTFELPEYKGLEIESESTDVADEEVTRELDSLLEQSASWEELPLGEQGDDDVIVADVTLGEGEEASIRREDVYLKIGNDKVDNIQVDGLSDRLRGAEASADLEFEVQVPEDFPRDELRNQQAPLRVQVKGARRRVVPELNDEFVEKLGVGSADELRNNIRENLETRRRVQEHHRQEEELIERISGNLEIELPPTVVERKVSELKLGLSYRLLREGKSKEEIDKLVEEDTSIEDEARKELRQLFILDEIAAKERVFVTEDEVAGRIHAIALTYNRDPNEVLEEYQERGELGEVRNGLLRENVRKLIREKAKVNSGSGDGNQEGESSTDEEN